MKVLLAGPIDGHALAQSCGQSVQDVPAGYGYSPLNTLARGLVARGIEVEIVTLDAVLDAPQSQAIGPFKVTFCPVRGAPRFRARARAMDLFAREIGFLRQVMVSSSCDLVHAHWTYEFAEAALRCGKPNLVTMHDLGWDCLRLYRDPYRAMRLIMKYRVMLRARNISAVSPHVAARAIHYGHFGEVAVIANPIEQARLEKRSIENPIFVTVGSDSRLKNVRASLAAFVEIRRRIPSAQLHLFGPGLGPQGAFAKPAEGVIYHGEVAHNDLMRFLAERATLLIHPSRNETFGLILGEAKMRGVPVIAGQKSGGTSYVVGHSGGVLVDIVQPDQIASAAMAILEDPAAYRRMQQAGHDDASRRFGVDRIAGDYINLYRKLLNRKY